MKFTIEPDRIYYQDLAEITFPKVDDQTVDINHTFVDPSLAGQGIAAQMVELAYEQIKSQHLKTYTSCRYAEHWFAKHPNHQDILKKDPD